MDRFDAMRLFTRIVELGSFTKAANDLDVPRATSAPRWMATRITRAAFN
jgi:DNA-binding transcriptional LysR family regulator